MANCGLDDQQRFLVQRFDPLDISEEIRSKDKHPADTDTIGFFVAKFCKNSGDITGSN